MKINKVKKFIPYILLIGYGLALIYFVKQTGFTFISTCDFPAQHLAFADYFRKLFYETGDLLPDFAGAIGGGQNIYNFSYYGLLRPDVLISFLLPNVKMIHVMITYSIFLYLLGGCLLFAWLKNHKFSWQISLLMGFMFLSSSILFHSHRQIMFVNYMPFLILSLWGVDKYLKTKKPALLIFGIFFTIMHSYYFSVSCIIICCIYTLFRVFRIYKRSNNSIKQYIIGKHSIIKPYLWMFVGVMASGILLIPTAATMILNMRAGSTLDTSLLLDVNKTCNTLFYDYYGCGFSFFIWMVLCIGLTMKKTRWISFGCIAALMLPVVAYILNGTLYIHEKVYMTFIPVILYLCAKILHLKSDREPSDYKWLIVILFLPVFYLHENIIIGKKLLCIDIAFTIFIVIFAFKFVHGKWFKQILFFMAYSSAFICLFLNTSERFMSEDSYAQFYENDEKINSNADTDYRFESLAGGIYNSNRITDANLWQTSIYSSIQNQNYENFLDYVMQNSTTSRNNMAHTGTSNIFFEMFMGIKYFYSKTAIPAGYENVGSKDKYGGSLVANNDVIPIMYATSKTMEYNDFENIFYPYTLDTLVNCAIINCPEKHNTEALQEKVGLTGTGNTVLNSVYNSKIKSANLKNIVTSYEDDDRVYFNAKEATIKVKSKDTFSYNIGINNSSDIVILTMKIDTNNAAEDTFVLVNSVKEKISGTKAPYQNNNTEFQFVLSANEPITNLRFVFSGGEYTLSDIKLYTCNYEDINKYKNEIDYFEFNECKGNEILSGTVNAKNSGYVITSIPYQKGISATVDGNNVNIENVNTSFIGFKITKGQHNVRISYKSPGKTIGIIVSLIGLLIWLSVFIVPFVKNRKSAL